MRTIAITKVLRHGPVGLWTSFEEVHGTINGKPFVAHERSKTGSLSGTATWRLEGDWSKGDRIAVGRHISRESAKSDWFKRIVEVPKKA